MPSVRRARLQGLATQCQANLRQIGTGLQGYVAEHHYYPGGHTWSDPPDEPAYITWAPRIRAYTPGGADTFWCPVAKEDSKWAASATGEKRLIWSDAFSYGYNNWGCKDNSWPKQFGLGGYSAYAKSKSRDWGELPASRVQVPSDMIAISDSTINHYWDAFIDPEPHEFLQWPSDRHFGYTEVLFCDGHVEQTLRGAIIGLSEDVTIRWNNDHQPH